MENLAINNFFQSIYRNKKVFVTGHTGFKGAWFIAWLGLLGSHVKGYALAPDEKSLFNEMSFDLSVEHVIADIRDKTRLQAEILAFRPDFVFHFAAQPLVRRSFEIPAETFDVNATGTANLLETLVPLKNRCCVVIVTTDKVYENKETGQHYKETDILGGYDPYSASKACAEIVTSSFRNSFFNAVTYPAHLKAIASARAGNVIGGGDWNKDRIVPDLVNSLNAENPVLVRSPNSVRPWQHVLEPLSGYLLLGGMLSQEPARFSGAYNFGPEENDHISVRNLVETALSCWGKGSWTDASDSSQPHEARMLQLDISKAKHELGWKPKLTSQEAIGWTIAWYRQPGNRRDYTINQIKDYQAR